MGHLTSCEAYYRGDLRTFFSRFQGNPNRSPLKVNVKPSVCLLRGGGWVIATGGSVWFSQQSAFLPSVEAERSERSKGALLIFLRRGRTDRRTLMVEVFKVDCSLGSLGGLNLSPRRDLFRQFMVVPLETHVSFGPIIPSRAF